MKFIALRNDTYYIKELIAIQKDCWHLNLDMHTSTCYMVNYLSRRLFNPRKQPFICSFKKKLISLYHSPVVNEDEVIKTLDVLHIRAEY